jgi:hypothetical protein
MGSKSGLRQRAQYVCSSRNPLKGRSPCHATATAKVVDALAVAEAVRVLDAVLAVETHRPDVQ